MISIFKTILSASNFCEEQNKTLTCIWNLCFDEKVIRFFSFIRNFEKVFILNAELFNVRFVIL